VKNYGERFSQLDLLRFFASLSVVIYHYKTEYIKTLPSGSSIINPLFFITKFGYLGVDLFFIISGFVIFMSASGRTARQFLISRGTRVYPTLWACATLTALVSIILPGTKGHTIFPIFLRWLASLTLLNEYVHIDYVDGVYWTLLLELQFYFMVFALLRMRVFRYEKTWLTIWLISTLSFLLFRQPFFMKSFIDPQYSPLFIAGVTFYLTRRDGSRPYYIAILLVSLCLSTHFAYGVVDAFAHQKVTVHDRCMASLAIIGFYIVFFLISTKRFTLKTTPLLLAIGGMTYPLYLLHLTIGICIFKVLKGYIPAIPLFLGTIVLIMATALSVHIFFERKVADRLKAALMQVNFSLRTIFHFYQSSRLHQVVLARIAK
jgi:peptidoglycan/LPS O-acetylase OafA/YrhL